MVLAVLSIITGYFGIPGFLEPVFATGTESSPHHGGGTVGIMILATSMGLLGIAGAYYVYVIKPGIPDQLARQWKALYQGSLHKWYVDEAYDHTIVRPMFFVADELWKKVDVAVIDGTVNGVAHAIAWSGWLLRLVQSGQIQHYALGMALGAVVFLTILLII
jgi:NADH-quinone oxidoreductase subunit L